MLSSTIEIQDSMYISYVFSQEEKEGEARPTRQHWWAKIENSEWFSDFTNANMSDVPVMTQETHPLKP